MLETLHGKKAGAAVSPRASWACLTVAAGSACSHRLRGVVGNVHAQRTAAPDSSDGADRGLGPEHFSQAVGGLSRLEILLLLCVSQI